ncbi:MAG: hypothetical protein QOJ59_1540 [Thermomicrobiales bacterium]|nr:hypothetical protein [Thermomicrobiales bacterium]
MDATAGGWNGGVNCGEVELDSWSSGDPQLGTGHDSLRLMPSGEIAQRVFTHEEDEFGRLELLVEEVDCVGRVGGAVPIEIDEVDVEVRRVGEGESKHGEPAFVLADDLGSFVGRSAGGDEQDAVE